MTHYDVTRIHKHRVANPDVEHPAELRSVYRFRGPREVREGERRAAQAVNTTSINEVLG